MDIRESILNEREKRMKLIRSTLGDNKLFIISIKCNVCGNNKNFAEFEFIKRYFLNLILKCFTVESYTYYESVDGHYYLVQIHDTYIESVKRKLVELEQSSLGRFVDLDLYTNQERSISRSDLNLASRRCIVCNDDASKCMRELRHSIDEVLYSTRIGIQNDLIDLVVDCVISSMTKEVSAHPKFGLVTEFSSGKHSDMDFQTFIKSINSLRPYFVEYARAGFMIDDDTFNNLREIGKKAEMAMFEATNNVNTHKGSIFILGFLIPSIIDALYYNKPFNTISDTISFLAKDILLDFNQVSKQKTIGEIAYAKYKISGVRGEVKNGLSKVFDAVAKFDRCDDEDNCLVIDILINFMSTLNDTVILHNQDIGFLEYVKTVGKEVASSGGYQTDAGKKLVEYYTKEFISLNISPGGSADMVIATLALLDIKKSFY